MTHITDIYYEFMRRFYKPKTFKHDGPLLQGLAHFSTAARTWIAVALLLLGNRSMNGADVPRFQDIVEQHFDRWIAGGKGVLTAERVKELVLHPEIRGAEAAAIASIHCYQRKAGAQALKMTRELLVSNHKEDPTLRRDQAASGKNFGHNYASFLKHIQSAPRSVFTAEPPSLEGISQGHLGDCYFVAGIGSIAHWNPDQLRRLLIPRDDGACDVRFPNGHNMRIARLTDAELALGSNAGNQGLWLNILESAAGLAEQRERNKMQELSLDLIGGGGDSVFTIQLLTGHKAMKELIRPHAKGARPAPAEHDVPKLALQVSRAIQQGLDQHRMVCCGVGDWHVPPGMGSYHQYAILGLKEGFVELWNPWGHVYHFKPNGPPGLTNGYPTEGGRFSMPIHDFVRVFGAVNVESNLPLR